MQPAVYIEGKFDEHGKWMDGKHAVDGMGDTTGGIKLGHAGVIRGVDIDTSHFTGNFPPAASHANQIDEKTQWVSLIETTELQGDSHHFLGVGNGLIWTHLRLNIIPDGGISRLRLFGKIA